MMFIVNDKSIAVQVVIGCWVELIYKFRFYDLRILVVHYVRD